MPMPKGSKHSIETKLKMSKTHRKLGTHPPSWLGKKHTEEWKKNMSLRTKGRPAPWNIIKNKDPKFWTPARRLKLSESLKKVPINWEAVEKTRKKNTGKKRTPEQRMRISLALRGSKSSFWKGGLTPEHAKIRVSGQYKEWRRLCFERNKYTCRDCWKKKCYLQVHHIKSFCNNPKLRFNTKNGITLCLSCHQKRHKNVKIRAKGTNTI